MNRVHIWSDIPKDWRSSSGTDANEHAAENGDMVINVNSLDELLALFNEWVKMEISFDVMDFHTHGGPGVINIGSCRLTSANLYRLYTSNVDRIFNNNAQVVFNGCNVAQDYWGEFFLLRFGKMMLKGGGGKVLGNTGTGIADPLFTGDVYHPFGDWVSVEVGMGGGAKLNGHRHLVSKNVNARIKTADEKIRKLESNGTLSAFDMLEINTWLTTARIYAANPTAENMFNSCDHLRIVEQKISEKERAVVFKKSFNIH